MIFGHASFNGGSNFARRFSDKAHIFYRPMQDLFISDIGIGTSSGELDDETDAAYVVAVRAALQAGVNIIDTSINYRAQRSERSVARGIKLFIEKDGGERDQIAICTKGGYLVPGGVTKNTVKPEELIGGKHCIAPAFLADQIRRSRENLSLQTIDIYYLHNPEIQLAFIDEPQFRRRLFAAFEQLEQAVVNGCIRYYGVATWTGFCDGSLSLQELTDMAYRIAGAHHHFRFIQLPFSLLLKQPDANVIDIALASGITVISSASLLRGRLSDNLPTKFKEMTCGLETDAQRVIHFIRSAPGISSALVGMRQLRHVSENLALAARPRMSPAEFHVIRSQCFHESKAAGTRE